MRLSFRARPFARLAHRYAESRAGAASRCRGVEAVRAARAVAPPLSAAVARRAPRFACRMVRGVASRWPTSA
ncbi:hypothetical protein M218_14125 [Burkholderia pseudomallei MSHR338]|nr:conserved hypothetical protein [Burkholderia pseudomallei MSHR346]EQA88366.1 hypothetical protein M218_14125 [Burkholderia pseudomallei MSHR338]